MMFQQNITIRFSELVIRFNFPTPIRVPDYLREFLYEGPCIPDTQYDICLLEKPLELEHLTPIVINGLYIYPYHKSWLYVYPALTAEDKCQVALFFYSDNHYQLYYPASRWDYYSEDLHFLHLLAIERFLIHHQGFLLHSSLVQLDGQAVLFSGPSGVGKSTQADLWHKNLNASVLNGDRCVIRKISNTFYGCGSPWAGTSQIYHRDMAPIKGIILLQQSPQNAIKKIGAAAFSKLFSQSVVNAWDSAFVNTLSTLIAEIIQTVPIYELSCRPDADAVQLAYQTLWKGDL